jgi:MFS family permease
MWTWVPVFIAVSLAVAGADAGIGGLAAFAVVGAGAIGCFVGGLLGDGIGRSATTIAAMAASGASALALAVLFGGPPLLVLAVAIVWGITIVADSAQFSTAVSELAPRGTSGSALSLQLASGFVLTSITILALGLFDPSDPTGWRVAFAVLALGPAVGIWAMWRLRQRPEAVRMAGGRR